MTARVRTLRGPEAGGYYLEALPAYYLDAGEPPGRWFGTAAAGLGLVGQVDPAAFVNLMAGRHPLTGDTLGRRYGERSVRGYDVTFSAPKSVSILWALAPGPVQDEVEGAHDAAVAAVLGFVEAQAHTRARVGGQTAVVDARGLIAAVFRQHTSRAEDPQLHTHAVVVAKVQAPDGRWLALDGRTLKCDQRALSSLYHALLRAELTRRLGARWGPVGNGIAELG